MPNLTINQFPIKIHHHISVSNNYQKFVQYIINALIYLESYVHAGKKTT